MNKKIWVLTKVFNLIETKKCVKLLFNLSSGETIIVRSFDYIQECLGYGFISPISQVSVL